MTGPQLYAVYPHGSYDRLPFLTMGTTFHPVSMPTPSVSADLGSAGTSVQSLLSSYLGDFIKR